ncbi:phage tail protein [Halomonas daqingensis]|uniref:Phage tail protein n=1 Tax=Billgrantia desiderata TaxID=52021 RepID=A0AAW4YW93_9GAMM|nr:phage tail tube protein [Halomonas desiderata]MCE8052277.1 phage tail protein [Halomonas desiderata]
MANQVIKSQGTDLFVINTETNEVLDIGCVTSISGITSPTDQIETTCLQDQSRQYVSGLKTPGTATFGIYLDTQNPTHLALHAAYNAGTNLVFAIAFSDGTGEPTVTDGDVELPDSRSWIQFEGYVSDFPFSFEQNSVVSSDLSVQISGEVFLLARVIPEED